MKVTSAVLAAFFVFTLGIIAGLGVSQSGSPKFSGVSQSFLGSISRDRR